MLTVNLERSSVIVEEVDLAEDRADLASVLRLNRAVGGLLGLTRS